MALQGTLSDFGLPDIFQLVGHQQKTGVLVLKDKDVEVKIFFVEGNVVKAAQASRDAADLLGQMMVRARAITELQLDTALATQERTLKRLGDVLIEMNATDRGTIKEMARLQTTETIYRLFRWRRGTYEFTAAPVDYDDQSYDPIRAESLLMEGFRLIDEWPGVKKIVPTSRCTFEILKDIVDDAPRDNARRSKPVSLEDLLGSKDEQSGSAPAAMAKVGPSELTVFQLVTPGRTTQEIVDLSWLGEFEATKALAALVKAGFLRVLIPAAAEGRDDEERITLRGIWEKASPVLTRVALYAVVAAAVGGLVRLASVSSAGPLVDAAPKVTSRPLTDCMSEVMRTRIEHALGVFRLERGKYPYTLDDLVAEGLLEEHELSFPFEGTYAYKTVGDGYILAPPPR